MSSGNHGWDAVSLGEVMLRFDPGEGRIRNTHTFTVYEGGGEYNVVRALRACFDRPTAAVTALVDNEVGRLVEGLVLASGVDVSSVRWIGHDGVGRTARNGLNFLERGFGAREGLGVSDRAHTATAGLRPGDIDWDTLLANTRLLHTGGVFAALSSSTPDVAEEAMIAARRHGALVSYDLNFRASLWAGTAGIPAAVAVNRRLVRHADVLIGNEGQLAGLLGLDLDPAGDLATAGKTVAAAFPAVRTVGVTRRSTSGPGRADQSAAAWHDGAIVESARHRDLPVLDRVGSGDAFAAGLLDGLLADAEPQHAVDVGAAAAVLATTTPGDALIATRGEVEALASGAAPELRR